MMKKLISMFIALLTMVCGAKAKIVETTLWNGTYTDGVELNSTTVATFKAGDVMRVYVTVPEGGANFKICYKGAGNGWNETTIPSLGNQWLWVNGGDTYKDFTLTSADITALSGMNIYIYKGENSTIDKVSLLTEEADDPVEEGTPTQLWSGTNALGDWGNFESLRYDGKGELANAKVGDDIRVTFTNATEGWQVYVCDAASYVEFTGGYFAGSAQEEAQTVSFRIANATVLEAIQDRGIVVKGKLVTLTKIEIVTYTTSYDAVAVTIGDDGIATFSSAKHHSFAAAGITPYYASEVGLGSVTLTSIEDKTTWKYQGYILKGMPGSYTIPVVESDDDATYPFGTNNLKATEEYERTLPQTGEEDKYIYIFAKDGEDIGFYYLNGKNYTLAAHRAYLLTDSDIRPASGARVALNFDDGDPTAVVSVGESKQDNVYYNLNGMRVTNPSKGVYVVNGKKVIIK